MTGCCQAAATQETPSADVRVLFLRVNLCPFLRGTPGRMEFFRMQVLFGL